MTARADADPFEDSFTALIKSRALTAPPCWACSTPFTRGRPPRRASQGGSGLDEAGTEALAGTLVAAGYLDSEDGLLRNTPVSERLLVTSSPESIATFVGAQADLHWQILGLLPQALRSGRSFGCTRNAGTRPSAGRDTSAASTRSRGRRTS